MSRLDFLQLPATRPRTAAQNRPATNRPDGGSFALPDLKAMAAQRVARPAERSARSPEPLSLPAPDRPPQRAGRRRDDRPAPAREAARSASAPARNDDVRKTARAEERAATKRGRAAGEDAPAAGDDATRAAAGAVEELGADEEALGEAAALAASQAEAVPQAAAATALATALSVPMPEGIAAKPNVAPGEGASAVRGTGSRAAPGKKGESQAVPGEAHDDGEAPDAAGKAAPSAVPPAIFGRGGDRPGERGSGGDGLAALPETAKDAQSAQTGPNAATPAFADLLKAADGLGAKPVAHAQRTVVTDVPAGRLPVEIGLKALEGARSFEIRLSPEELGRVDVKLDIDEAGHVKAHLVVERPEALALLTRDRAQLEQALEQAGLRPADGGIAFSLRDGSADPGGSGLRNGNDRPQPGGGPVPQKDETGSAGIAATAPRALLTRLGALDLRI